MLLIIQELSDKQPVWVKWAQSETAMEDAPSRARLAKFIHNLIRI